MADYIDWPGQSGKKYRYFFVDLSLPIDAVGANYCFVKKLADGKFRPLYFGETEDAQDRLCPAHEKWAAALALGMTDVMAHATPGGENVRCDEEQDLIARWQPILNVQHRNVRE